MDERERKILENAKARVLAMIAKDERDPDDELYLLDALNSVLLGIGP